MQLICNLLGMVTLLFYITMKVISVHMHMHTENNTHKHWMIHKY